MIGVGVSPFNAALLQEGEEMRACQRFFVLGSADALGTTGGRFRVVKTGTWSCQPSPPVVQVLLAAAGANKSWQILLDDNQYDDSVGVMWNTWPHLKYRIGAEFSVSTLGGSKAGLRGGIQIGTPAEQDHGYPPWPTIPIAPYARLGWDLGADQCYFEAAVGDGVTALYRVLFDPPGRGIAALRGGYVELIWNPYLRKLSALFDHVVMAEIDDTDLLLQFGNNPGGALHRSAGGLFLESGTDVLSLPVCMAGYPETTLWHPAAFDQGATLWYE